MLAYANSANQIAPSAEDGEPIAVGTGAPDAHLRDMEGKEVTLHAIIALSLFHQRHIGRVLRSSCNTRGRRLYLDKKLKAKSDSVEIASGNRYIGTG